MGGGLGNDRLIRAISTRPPQVLSRLQLQRDGLYLYRSIIPPLISNLAFVGSEVTTNNNILTDSLQAKWLAQVLSGTISLPSVKLMQVRWKNC